jgi:hypothetical protein
MCEFTLADLQGHGPASTHTKLCSRLISHGLQFRIGELTHEERLKLEYLLSVLGSGTLEPSPPNSVSAAGGFPRPWVADRRGRMAVQQFSSYRHAPEVELKIPAESFAKELTGNPSRWWQDYGSRAEFLQDVALRMACIPGAAAGEVKLKDTND